VCVVDLIASLIDWCVSPAGFGPHGHPNISTMLKSFHAQGWGFVWTGEKYGPGLLFTSGVISTALSMVVIRATGDNQFHRLNQPAHATNVESRENSRCELNRMSLVV